jgi:hypothetical protein
MAFSSEVDTGWREENAPNQNGRTGSDSPEPILQMLTHDDASRSAMWQSQIARL